MRTVGVIEIRSWSPQMMSDGLDRVKLGERDMGLLPFEQEKLAVVLFGSGGVGLGEAGFVLFLFFVPQANVTLTVKLEV
jgi:hypothetical protein